MDWILVIQNSYVEALIPTWHYLATYALSHSLDLIYSCSPHSASATLAFLWLQVKYTHISLSLSTYTHTHQEKTTWGHKNKATVFKPGSPHQNPTILAPWSQTSSLQNNEKINSVGLSHPVYDIVMAAQLTKTLLLHIMDTISYQNAM